MRVIVSILLIMIVASFNGQQLGNNVASYARLDTNEVSLSVVSEGYYGSSIFNNGTISKFINGGFISDEEKELSLQKAKDLNHLGGEFNTTVSYSNPRIYLVKDFGFYTDLSYNYSLGTQFTKDAYTLLFFGNKDLAGDEAILSPSAFYLRDMNSFSFGLNKKNQLKFGLTLSSFNNNSGAEISRGILTTDSTGNEITMDVNGNYYAVDTSRSVSLFSNNAIGIGVDFETVFNLNKTPNSSKVVVGARNVGILVQNNTYQIEAQSEYSYKGIEVTNLSNISTELLTAQSVQDSLGVETKTGQKTSLLPFEIYFYQIPSYTKRIELIYGFRYKNQSAYKAFLYAGGNVKLNELINVSSYVSHGGYANFQWGISSQFSLNKLKVGVNSGNIIGFVSDKAYGKSLGISIAYLL